MNMIFEVEIPKHQPTVVQSVAEVLLYSSFCLHMVIWRWLVMGSKMVQSGSL